MTDKYEGFDLKAFKAKQDRFQEERKKEARTIGISVLNLICFGLFCLAIAFGGMKQIAVSILFWSPFLFCFWKWDTTGDEDVPSGESSAPGPGD